MCLALLLFMGNAISGGGGGGRDGGGRKPTESGRSDVSDLQKMTVATATVDELTRDVERLKAAMDEKDRTIEQLGRAVEDIRVSLILYYMIAHHRLSACSRRVQSTPNPQWRVRDSMTTIYSVVAVFCFYPDAPTHTRVENPDVIVSKSPRGCNS